MHATKSALRTAPACPESALPPSARKLEGPAALVKAPSLAFLMRGKPDLSAPEAFLANCGMRGVSRTANQLGMCGAGSEPPFFMTAPLPR
ncbi:hypothetical protein [Paraburkholderia sp. MM5477-R1]|uniref:hypothetical protein n=1 Tax=Paraburkholderia sp. MM5477-R1 TaxID=2991062 RepID=UPI003D25B584